MVSPHVPARGAAGASAVPGRAGRPGNLPVEPDSFHGRTSELRAVESLLARSRLVTVTGPGGVGKTRFALRAAAAVSDRFPDGVWLVELSPLRDPDLAVHAVTEALGLTDHTTRRTRDVLAGHLSGRELLLVLDCCEHLVDACAELAVLLLGRAPGLRVLVTSRRPLDAAGEHTFVLPPLAVPPPYAEPDGGADNRVLADVDVDVDADVDADADISADVDADVGADRGRDSDRALGGSSGGGPCPVGEGHVPGGDAVRLFAERAAAAVPGFTVDDGDRADVAELCRRLDGIPLAVELAAGRMRTLSVRQLLARLDDRFTVLTDGSRTGPPRHRALRTAVGWSHELCTPEERLLWARLSVFAGDFDLEAVEYVCAGEGLPVDGMLGLVAALVAQSVVQREECPAGVRYRMLGTVREYGLGWLDAQGGTERIRRRHRDWYLGLATWGEVDWFGARQAEVAERTDREFPNLRLALEFSLTVPGEAYLGQYLAGTLWFYWVGCGRLAEGWHWLSRALDLDSAHDDTRAKALWVAGYVAVLQGNTVRALGLLHECAAQALRGGDEVAAAYAVHRIGCLALVSDDLAKAEELFRHALRDYRALGELSSNVIMAQVELAMAVAFQGRTGEAVALCEEAREICEDHGERWARAYALYVLGYTAWSRGAFPRARRLARECLETSHNFRDLVGTVLAVELLALVSDGEGDPGEAALLQGAAARMWRAVGLPLFGSRHFTAPRTSCEERLRAELGDARYEAAFAAGARLGRYGTVARLLPEEGRAGGGPARPGPFRARPSRQHRTSAVSPPTRPAD